MQSASQPSTTQGKLLVSVRMSLLVLGSMGRWQHRIQRSPVIRCGRLRWHRWVVVAEKTTTLLLPAPHRRRQQTTSTAIVIMLLATIACRKATLCGTVKLGDVHRSGVCNEQSRGLFLYHLQRCSEDGMRPPRGDALLGSHCGPANDATLDI